MVVYLQGQQSRKTIPQTMYEANCNYFRNKHLTHAQLMACSSGDRVQMARILIVGSSGAGKSTLARQLGAKLNLPVIHLDCHFWGPDWEPASELDWQARVAQLVKRPFWIIDGNYRSTLDERLAAADTVIFLDLPPALCVARAIKRRLAYRHHPRPDIAQGCKEPLFDRKFPAFLRWIMNYPHRARPDVVAKLAQVQYEKKIVLLKTPHDVQAFLDGVQ